MSKKDKPVAINSSPSGLALFLCEDLLREHGYV